MKSRVDRRKKYVVMVENTFAIMPNHISVAIVPRLERLYPDILLRQGKEYKKGDVIVVRRTEERYTHNDLRWTIWEEVPDEE